MLFRLLKWRLAGLFFAWTAALFVVAWLVLAGREVAAERGLRSTAAFAAVVEQQIARTFQGVYLTLGAIADTHRLHPRPATNDAQFQEMMSRRLKDIPFVRATFIVDTDGWIIHDTDYPRTPRVSLTDREYFRAYRSEAPPAERAWGPLESRSGSGWFVPVTRPLGSGDRFEGVVVAAIQTSEFERQFRDAGLPSDHLVSLFHRDGTLVASHPGLPANIGMNYRRLDMFARLAHDSSGSFRTSDGVVAGKRLVSYRAVTGTPFVVRVSSSEHDVLAEWRRTATGAALAMLALTVFVGWMMLRLGRDSLRRARERERRSQADKMEALGQLSGGMAHDFANVLNVIALNAGVLRTSSADPVVADEALSAVERAVRSGQQVTERLLAFARRRPLSLVPVRLDAWLEAARPLVAHAVGPRVTLEMRADQPVPEILCDLGELDLALLNLAVNARDAVAGQGRVSIRAYPCDEGSGAPQALVARPPRFVCLTVEDDGSGMPDSVRRRAFEPFYTTKGERGTGLGLTQVYGFMQQLGGHMTIESAPGRGTAIHLYFPVAAPDAVA